MMKEKVGFMIMRLSLGFVFLVFGIGKFQDDIWAQTIRNMPFFEALPWGVDVSVVLVGLMEVVTGLALLIGLLTRVFALLAAVQLLGILILLNFDQIRDIGLLGAAIYMALNGHDWGGIGQLTRRRSEGRKAKDN